MKIFLIFSLVFSGLLTAEQLQPKDLVGIWKMEHSQIPGMKKEGLKHESDEIIVFYENGIIYTEGLAHISLIEGNVKLLSFGGPDLENWSVNNGILTTKTKILQFDLIVSKLEPTLLQKILEGIKLEAKKPIVSTLVEKNADKIVLKDKEDNSVTTYTRIKDEQYAALLAMKGKNIESLFGDPKRVKKGEKDLIGEQLRRLSLTLLKSEKFKVAAHLPTFSNRPKGVVSVRDRREILDRLLCSYVISYWTMREKIFPSKTLLAFAKEFKLADKMTKEEKEIFALSREEAADHIIDVGWKMENMFALAWVLGLDLCPNVTDAQAGEVVAKAFIAHLQKEIKALRAGKPLTKIRSLREVAQLEDIFYCAHNAVRSAQLGKKDCIPKGFHPMRNGGVISEKRHALTWVLSVGVKWDDTDLSS